MTRIESALKVRPVYTSEFIMRHFCPDDLLNIGSMSDECLCNGVSVKNGTVKEVCNKCWNEEVKEEN